MAKQTLRWLKVSACLYGILITLVFGGVLISLFIHGDLMLIQAPLHLDWIAGDIVLLLTIFWGILFALANLAENNALSILGLVLALTMSAIVGWINWQMGGMPWGVLMSMILFCLPSWATYRALSQLRNGSKV